MDAKRFYSVSFDARNHPKVSMLRLTHGGIVAYGRYQALLGILYDQDGLLDLSTEVMTAYLAYELEYNNYDDLNAFLNTCADLDLINADIWHSLRHVGSNSVNDQIEYFKAKQRAGEKGGKESGKARRKKKADQGTLNRPADQRTEA